MKKTKHTIVALLLVLVPALMYAQDYYVGGIKVSWETGQEGTVSLEGHGTLTKSPFINKKHAAKISSINLVNFYGTIQGKALSDCKNLTKLILPADRHVDCTEEAFANDIELETIEFQSSKVEKGLYRVAMEHINLNEYNSRNPWTSRIKTSTNLHIVIASTTHITPPLEWFKPYPDISTYSNLEKRTGDYGEYNGQAKYGKRNGIGKYTWKDGDWYIGEWKDGERTGFGEYHDSSGWVYMGDYLKGVRTGKGMFKWQNGDVYVGDFVDGNRTGMGTYYWPKERSAWRIYHGGFNNNKLCRHGIVMLYDGDVQMGVWSNDSYKGQPEAITLDEFLAFPEVLPLNLIAKYHVEREVNAWQQKDEFETTADWRIRVTEETRRAYADSMYHEMVNRYLKNAAQKTRLNLTLGQYDADNGVFLIEDSIFGQMLVTMVGDADAKEFKKRWHRVTPMPTYYFNGETSSIDVKEIDFYLDNKIVAQYNNADTLPYVVIDVTYNFDPINIDLGKSNEGRRMVSVDTTTIATKSDVDINIPQTLITDKKTYAFIISNEEYRYAKNVPFALNDGGIFAKYCTRTLGIDSTHVTVLDNASLGEIIDCIDKMKKASIANNGDINIILYYAGHGFPDEQTHSAYLLPKDGNPSNPSTCYSLRRLYSELEEIQANQVVCFVDACFSGATREGGMLQEARGVERKPKDEAPLGGNVVVITASHGTETAHSYHEKRHGMFTYFLLKKLQDTKGRVSLGDLTEYIVDNVKKSSFDVNKKIQTPTVIPSPKVSASWPKMRL